MKSILLIYKTKTGFTKHYADWIAEDIFCKTVSFEKVKTSDINDHDVIIYGAGMHAGHILGINEFKKKVTGLLNKKVVIFATGAAPLKDEIIAEIKKNNFTENERESVVFFYFESGINYDKMGIADKTIMKIYSNVLKLKNNKSEIETGTSMAILTSYDHSSKEYTKSLVTYLKELLNESD